MICYFKCYLIFISANKFVHSRIDFHSVYKRKSLTQKNPLFHKRNIGERGGTFGCVFDALQVAVECIACKVALLYTTINRDASYAWLPKHESLC